MTKALEVLAWRALAAFLIHGYFTFSLLVSLLLGFYCATILAAAYYVLRM